VVGDWGGQPTSPYTTKAEIAVAKQMGATADSFGSSFTIAVGDNFYDSGVKNEYDSRFKTTFENVFTAPSLQTRWYVVAGNHDHKGNVSGEIAYTQHSNRWYFPAQWYTETFTDNGVDIQILFIDTVVFSGFWPKGAANPLGPTDPVKAQSELDWIEETLQNSTADWILVCGHYPVWSVAEHGPTQNLVAQLKPLLEKYQVAAYIDGHDHNMQHLREKGKQVNYFVVGAAHLATHDESHLDDVPSGALQFYWPATTENTHGGFATVKVVDKNSMEVTFIDDSAKTIYSYTVQNPRK
jgi:tartrate-resistant acid phosphatase type 5